MKHARLKSRSQTQLHAVASAASLLFLHAGAWAQATKPAAPPVDTIVVTGIRAAIQKSIDTKRTADTNIEVVSAEDVGKMPDKNIADALSRLPGVNVQYGGANAMDEAERVAIRGTAPNLNLVTLNGHALSAGDWHVGDQQAANQVSSRSVGFGLLPSQLIGQTIVYKTQRADITEGGLAGSVDVLLRKPLDFKNALNGELSLGGVYADLPGKTDFQGSGILAWKNDSNTFGVMVQAFKENRTLRRDGMETLGYTNGITAAQAGTQTNLIGLRMPNTLNATLFEGVREREGGYLSMQFKPNDRIDATLSGFTSKMKAENYNSSAYSIAANLLGAGWLIQDAKVDGDTIVSAKIVRPANAPATQQVIGMQFEHFVRQGARSTSDFLDLDVGIKATDKLKFRARAGTTQGDGDTPSQPSIYTVLINPNMQFSATQGRPADWTMIDSVDGQADRAFRHGELETRRRRRRRREGQRPGRLFAPGRRLRPEPGPAAGAEVRLAFFKTHAHGGQLRCALLRARRRPGQPPGTGRLRHRGDGRHAAALPGAHTARAVPQRLRRSAGRQLPARRLPFRHQPDTGLFRQVPVLGTRCGPRTGAPATA